MTLSLKAIDFSTYVTKYTGTEKPCLMDVNAGRECEVVEDGKFSIYLGVEFA